MLFYVEDNVQISGRSAERACFPIAAESDSRAIFHARGNFGLHHALTQDASLALAFEAGIGNHAARALARRASASHGKEPLLIPYLATSLARSEERRVGKEC